MLQSPSATFGFIGLFMLLLDLGFVSVINAATYATNVNTSSVGSTTAEIIWDTPTDTSLASYYILHVADEYTADVLNVTINDVTTTSYSLTGLIFSTYHNVTLFTHDASDVVLGSGVIYFLTNYDPFNFRAVCAMGVVGAIVLILIAVKVAQKVCNPDKAADEWRQEILVTKQREREERKKKLSSQAGVEAKADLGPV